MTAELRRGDLVLVNLEPVVGHEIGKTRPAVVVQNDVGNRYSPTVIVAAITEYTERKARFPVCVAVAAGEGGLIKQSLVSTAQLRTIDRRRIVGQPLGRLAAETLVRLDEALKISLGLS